MYLPVTLIRLMKIIFKKKISNQISYYTLGSMGEHIAPSVAEWFAKNFTNKNKPIINAYYQTENGAIIASPTINKKLLKYPMGQLENLLVST